MSPRHIRDHTRYPSHHRHSAEKKVHPTVDVEKVRDFDDVVQVTEKEKLTHFANNKNKSTMFLPVKPLEEKQHDVQTVNVTVNVNEPQEDLATSCFAGLAKCFGKS